MGYPKRKGTINRLRQIPLALRIARMRNMKRRKEIESNRKSKEESIR